MKILSLVTAAITLISTASTAQTVDWPSRKPVRIVVPFAAGGTADAVGRLVATQLQANLQQSFIVENRAGGGGAVGARQVSQSVPDGYTLVLAGGASHVIVPLLNGKGVETLSDATPIAMIGSLPSVLLVTPAIGVKGVKELIAKVQTLPEGLSWGSPGAGTSGHLAGEMFFRSLKLKQTHVSYQGGAPALNNLLGGHIHAAVMNLPAVVPHIKAGKITALLVTSEKRLPGLPDVPSFVEEGLPASDTWYGIAGPAAMPAPLVEKINNEVRQVLKADAVQKRLALEYFQPMDFDAERSTRYIKNDFERWGPLVQVISASIAK